MCFSAQASFVAGVTLTAIGLAAVRKADRSTIMLACIPLIFAVQQFAEWVIWLGPDMTSFVSVAKNIFLFIALVVWPLYIPATFFPLEKHTSSKVLIGLCGVAGILFLGYAVGALLAEGTTASVKNCHIFYEFLSLKDRPFTSFTDNFLWGLQISLYMIATICPFLLSTTGWLNILGIALGVSCLITYLVWYSYFISIWCFFAALLSLGLYTVIKYHDAESL
jgi:hypothetical protein